MPQTTATGGPVFNGNGGRPGFPYQGNNPVTNPATFSNPWGSLPTGAQTGGLSPVNTGPMGNSLGGSYGGGLAQTPGSNPHLASGWTGVSSQADPYGVGNIGSTPTGATVDQLLGMNTPTLPAAGAAPATNPYVTPSTDLQAPGTTNGQAITNLSNTLSQSQAASSYPAMPNSYGLGSSTTPAPATAAPAASSYSGQGVTVNVPDTSARGLNPWSLQGEANSRDTQAGVQTH